MAGEEKLSASASARQHFRVMRARMTRQGIPTQIQEDASLPKAIDERYGRKVKIVATNPSDANVIRGLIEEKPEINPVFDETGK